MKPCSDKASRMARLNDATVNLVAERFAALSEPMRLRLLAALRNHEKSVGQLVEETEAGQANVSKHLQVLLRHGFVERRKEGLHVLYRIADPRVFELCDLVCGALLQELEQKRKLLR